MSDYQKGDTVRVSYEDMVGNYEIVDIQDEIPDDLKKLQEVIAEFSRLAPDARETQALLDYVARQMMLLTKRTVILKKADKSDAEPN